MLAIYTDGVGIGKSTDLFQRRMHPFHENLMKSVISNKHCPPISTAPQKQESSSPEPGPVSAAKIGYKLTVGPDRHASPYDRSGSEVRAKFSNGPCLLCD